MSFVTLTNVVTGRQASVNLRQFAVMEVDESGHTKMKTECGMVFVAKESPAEIRLQWLNEGSEDIQPAAQPAPPSVPKTITVDELRVGDLVDLAASSNGMKRHAFTGFDNDGDCQFFCEGRTKVVYRIGIETDLKRGREVYRDGNLISGWPVESPPWGGDAGLPCIECAKWESAASHRSEIEIEDHDQPQPPTPDGLKRKIATLEANEKAQKQRITELEAELASLKSQPQEVPPLDPWRVLATAERVALDQIKKPGLTDTHRLFVVLQSAIRAAVYSGVHLQNGDSAPDPYRIQ